MSQEDDLPCAGAAGERRSIEAEKMLVCAAQRADSADSIMAIASRGLFPELHPEDGIFAGGNAVFRIRLDDDGIVGSRRCCVVRLVLGELDETHLDDQLSPDRGEVI